MAYEKDNPFAVVDKECDPPYTVARYDKVYKAEFHLTWLRDHGGKKARAKVERSGYRIDGPEASG